MKTDAEAPGTTPPPREGGSAPDPWGGSTIPAWSDQDSDSASSWQSGVRIDRYELIQRIGTGGMAEVWSARDVDLGREVAIKIIRSSGGWPFPEQRARLLREARAMARLSHPNVVTVHDVGTTHGGLFIVMERLDGGTLAEWLHATLRSCDEVVANFIDAGRGLAEAHRAGLVHRDFKPDNVLMGRDGIPRVSDFGLAFPVGEVREGSGHMIVDGGHALTQDRAPAGTLGYMPPEQLLGDRVTPRSDQFSFCAALYEALYTVKPFRTPSGEAPVAAFLSAMVERRFAPVPPGREVPARLLEIVLRGLASDPDERWPSMDALVAELELWSRPPRRRSWAELFDPLNPGQTLDRLSLGSAPTIQQPSQELLVQAMSAARRAEALALAMTNRKRTPLFLILFPLAVIVGAGIAIVWTVLRSDPVRPAPVTAAAPPPPQVQAMPLQWQGAEAPASAPLVDNPPPAPDPAAVTAARGRADSTAAADEVARSRPGDPGKDRVRREAPSRDHAVRARDERERERVRDDETRIAETGIARDNEQASSEEKSVVDEETATTAPPEPAPVSVRPQAIDQPATAAPAPMPRRKGPLTIPSSRAIRESGGDRPIHFPAGEQVPREVVAKLCIDPSGNVTSVAVLSRVSPVLRKSLEHALARWRYQPIVEAGEKVAACFATVFPVRIE